MQQFWTACLITLTFVALASSLKLILENTYDGWNWIPKHPRGVHGVSVNANVCHNDELQFEPVPLFSFPFHGKKHLDHCFTSAQLLTVNSPVRQTGNTVV